MWSAHFGSTNFSRGSRGKQCQSVQAIYLTLEMFPQNIDRLVNDNVADKLKLKSLDTDDLFAKIREILNNKTKYEIMKIRSEAFQSQPDMSLKRALFWINHILSFSEISLPESDMHNLNFFQRYNFDIILFIIVSVSIPLYVYFKLVAYAIFICYSNKPVRKIKRR